ncbi:MAG: tagatose 1,6-diphosphate aldolase [Chloroflexota bacterium]
MTKKELTIGKFRGMQQISTGRGLFTMVALDHQESFRKGINPAAPDSVPYSQAVDIKLDIIAALSPHSSALLTDLRYGVAQGIAAYALPGRTGLLVTLEQSPGYGAGETIARQTALVRGWNVARIRRSGASAVKLLVYYHPNSQTAGFQEDLVSRIAADCREHDIPLVLEVLTHPVEPGQAKESPEFAATRPRVVIESARRLCHLGADVYKAEFPADMKYESDQTKMLGWCQELTGAAGIPWVVLSAAVNHEMFCRQVEISCRGGASGFLAGRSIWKEALNLPGDARREFLAGDATRRLNELTAITDRYGHPWTDWYQATVGEGWYERY